MVLRRLTFLAVFAAAALALIGCERNITRVELDSQPLTCADCHDNSNLITGKRTQWEESVHGTGEAYLRGTSASCAGCHSGNAFTQMVAAGLAPNQLTVGDPNPTRQDCRACHLIHETYTMQDFALRTTAPVAFYALAGVTYNGGEGNLCVNCHQPRRAIPNPVGGVISGITTHWGPHHGPQSSMLLGVGGALVTGSPSGHYGGVQNTCVHCHMGDEENHTFEPEISTCRTCHPGATNFDINGTQTLVKQLSDSLGARLLALGLIDENSPEGEPIVTSAPEAQARALWNWLYVAHEDRSNGVHNRDYAVAMLQAGLAAVPAPQQAALR